MTKHKGTPQRQLRDWRRRHIKKLRERGIDRHALDDERDERDARVTNMYGEGGHWSCGRKYRYETEHRALMSAAMRELNGAPTLRAYHCKLCGGWHLTKKPEE